MTKLQLLELKRDTEQYLQGTTIKVLGLKAGVGSRVINDLLRENFDCLTDVFLDKIHAVVTSEEITGLIRTADCMAFLEAVERAERYQMMIGITGDTGTGKTYMSRAVAKKDNVLYWNCHLHKSPRVFFQELLIDMRESCGGTLSEMITRTAREMNRRRMVLIVDEADKMHKQIRGCIHTLRDRTARDCGILLVGMPALKNDLLRGKEAGKQGYAEFHRRVCIFHHMEGLRPDEIKRVVTEAGIEGAEALREFRKYTSFGELLNAIQLYKILND